MTELIGTLLGVLLGALIAIAGVNINNKMIFKEFDRREQIKEKMKEIDMLMLLNKKINEIMQKRDIEIRDDVDITNYEKVANFDDVKITIDDFIYLQSFCAQNHYYLPNYMVEEFFKKISHRKVVLDPQIIRTEGAYSYQGGRVVLEEFSEQLIRTAEDRKIELKQLTQKYRK
ncbi:hypothetical protein ACWN8V_05635 [Vagococcus elongatus]|uniref:Uncharacterized protein n=1 Tax=Vagococcus elongatus TaxID=180344 RepID=A0A430AX78_9ENTE|nr:hypothetical protein [Vagococcus elongatus]RSU12636.1 hypothetical protein CBF29_05775 [Vagococcus elongatus]